MRNLRSKKVGILGLGRENRSLVDFLIKKGARLAVCDKKEGLRFKKKNSRIKEWRLGKDYLKNLIDFDIIFRTPGIPYLTPEIQKAKQKGVEISSATKLFFDLCPAKIIAVTGTKGKGTTAALISEILKRNTKTQNLNVKIYLAGNIGKPAISLLDKLKPADWVVLELSSFQLQDLDKSPHIAVVLNIASDHLDCHRTKKEYFEAKENIVRHQTKNDFAVINLDYLTSFKFAAATKGKIYWFSARKSVDQGCFINSKLITRNEKLILRIGERDHFICPTDKIALVGEHNLENVCAAVTASYLAGVSIENIRKTLIKFKSLEHRLEIVNPNPQNQPLFINDSYSTTPESTIAAIKSFQPPIILICGGRSKGGNYRNMAEEIVKSKNIKMAILIGETAQEIKKILNSKSKIKNLKFASMKEIVKTAAKEAEPGDIVLFSPGAASFDMFKNAADRGKQFKEAVVNELQQTSKT